MARIRGLKPDFFKDEDLAMLPFEARLFFEGMWCYADKKGRMEDRPKYLKAEIFPYDRVDAEKMMALLANPQILDRPEKVFIRRYEVDGRKYIDIPEFLEHQKPHHTEKESKIPAFNGVLTVKPRYSQEDTVQVSVQVSVQDTVQTQDSEHAAPENSFPEKKEKPKTSTGSPGQEGAFPEFKTSYPKKNGKFLEEQETFRRFCLVPQDDWPLLIQAVKNYADSDQVKRGVGLKDPKNFIGDQMTGRPFWKEWLEPEKPPDPKDDKRFDFLKQEER